MGTLQDMRVFVEVAERRGFSAAARGLGMSAPAVTRAVANLESRLGVKLLARSTRAVHLTEPGRHYLADCSRILQQVEDAEAAVSGVYTTPTGTIVVTAPVMFGRLCVLPAVTSFLRLHESVTIHTVFVDRVVRLVEEGLDVAIRIGHLPDSSLSASRVGQVRRVVCASPTYLAEHGEPSSPAELKHHTLAARSDVSSLGDWRFLGRSSRVKPRLVYNSNQAAIDAALSGWGIIRVLSYQVDREIRAGRLVRLLADYEDPPFPVHVVHGEGRHASAAVRSFVDHAVTELRGSPLIDSSS